MQTARRRALTAILASLWCVVAAVAISIGKANWGDGGEAVIGASMLWLVLLLPSSAITAPLAGVAMKLAGYAFGVEFSASWNWWIPMTFATAVGVTQWTLILRRL